MRRPLKLGMGWDAWKKVYRCCIFVREIACLYARILLMEAKIMNRMIGLLMMCGLVVNVVGCGDDDSSPTSSSVSQDKYSETILGTWKDGGSPIWTFNADGTVVWDGYESLNHTWSIEGARLTITDADTGTIYAEYDITSLSSTQFVFTEPEAPTISNTQTR